MANNTTDPKAALQAPAKKPVPPVQQALERSVGQFQSALGDPRKAERFARAALTACKLGYNLMNCTPQSVVASCMKAAQLDLEVGQELGQAYLIAYGNDCQLQLGWQGLLELAQRSGVIETVVVEDVRENEEFSQQKGTAPKLVHVPVWNQDPGEVVGYYAAVTTVNGGRYFVAWDKQRCMEHGRKYSKSFGEQSSPWKTNPDAMCRKTVLKQVLKLIPKSVEVKRALAADDRVDDTTFGELGPDDYVVVADDGEAEVSDG